jgi:hypothetical protein
MLPNAFEQYLKEISRLLAPDGLCVATYFLLNEHSLPGVLAKHSFMSFAIEHASGLCRLHNPRIPEAAVAGPGRMTKQSRMTIARRDMGPRIENRHSRGIAISPKRGNSMRAPWARRRAFAEPVYARTASRAAASARPQRPGMLRSSMSRIPSGRTASTASSSPSGSSPRRTRSRRSGVPVAHACGLEAVGYSTGKPVRVRR